MCNDKPVFIVPTGIEGKHVEDFVNIQNRFEQDAKKTWHSKEVKSLHWDDEEKKLK